MKAKPYVGITGPVSVNEVHAIIREFQNVGYDMHTKHIPMLGFLVCYKSLQGLPMDNKRYPAVKNLNELLKTSNGKALTMIHYNTREPGLETQIQTLFNQTDIYHSNLCRAVQYNIVWPDVKEVNQIKHSMPELKQVIQLSQKAMENRTDEDIVMKLKDYDADYVLIDPSGGQGKEFDILKSVMLYHEISSACPNLTVGFAGGFTGENVQSKVEGIVDLMHTDDFCIDAEGGLRDKLSAKYGDDVLNIKKVRSYLDAAGSILE